MKKAILPSSTSSLLNKLIVAKDIYSEIYAKLSDSLSKMELRRIIIEKDIFIKDFNAVKGFSLTEFLNEFGDDIRVESNNLRINLSQLIDSSDDRHLFSIILKKEKELIVLYHMILRRPVSDQFMYMVLKNQLDETRQSINELNEIIENLISDQVP